MRRSAKLLLPGVGLCALTGVLAGCSPHRIPPMTVSDLLEDRVALDGVLMKCERHPSEAHDDVECQNARIAIAQMVKDPDPAVEARRTAAFEKAREQRRQALDKIRAEQEAKARVDAYELPVVPVDGRAASAAAPAVDGASAAAAP